MAAGGTGRTGRLTPAARLRAAFSLWSVRSLAALFAVATAVALLFLAEGARLREQVAVLERSRRQEMLLAGVAEAVQALDRRLAGAVQTPGGGDPFAVETATLRQRLQALGDAPHGGADPPTGPLAEMVGRVEALGGRLAAGVAVGVGEAERLREPLGVRWQQLSETVRAAAARAANEQLWSIAERSRQRLWILVFLGCAAGGVLLAAVWAAGGGVAGAEEAIRALAAGEPVTDVGSGGELGGLRRRIAAAAVTAAEAERRRQAEKERRERFYQRLEAALRSVASGDSGRPLPPPEDPACEGAVAAIGRVLELQRAAEERAVAERARLQDHELVPREELFQLQQLFELDPVRQEQAARVFGPQSRLREVAERIASVSGRNRSLGTQLEERASRILEQAGTIATAVQEREGEFRKESQLIHDTSTTVNEVSVAAKQTAQMVEFVFRSSQEAMSAAEDGRDLVRRTIEGMGLIAQRVSQIAEQILQLAGKSQEIGNIVKVIGDISKQTNLLALNAAIEAAGAGEHGRGFAVVAKEIRELAVKSSRSTQDIQHIIREIQAATNSAVLSTEEGSKSVQGGMRLATSLNQAFGQVVEKFQEVVESAQQISTAAQEQTAGARQVAGSISGIDQMVRATVEDLQGLRQVLGDYQEVTREFAAILRERVPAGGGGV